MEISKETSIFKGIFLLIDSSMQKGDALTIAIEGNSGAGKSHLAGLLSARYDCNIFHMDDFFLQPHQRTKDRLDEVGGNIDYERFLGEIINNIQKKQKFKYQIYDCKKQQLTTEIIVQPKKLSIIEGVYSMHPLWFDKLDIKLFLKLDEEIQTERILKRNGEYMLKRFQDEWIPMENKYFKAYNVEEKCDLVINTSNL